MGTFSASHSKTAILRKRSFHAFCPPQGYQMEMSAKGERKEGWYCVWAAVANLLEEKGGSAAVAAKCASFIWLDFPDHIEGHPHSLTTIHKPLASTGIGTAANIYNGKGCSLTAWQRVQHSRVSATAAFCTSASAIGTPNAQGKVNQTTAQALKSCAREAISWDRWCDSYTGTYSRRGDRLCTTRKEVMQLEEESTLSPGTPEPGVPAGARHASCNATGPLSLTNIYICTHTYTNHILVLASDWTVIKANHQFGTEDTDWDGELVYGVSHGLNDTYPSIHGGT